MDTAASPGPSARWEHYSHGADIGVRGIGPSRACAFEQAGLALTAVISDPKLVKPVKHVHISVTEPDPELLFAKWLNAVIFEMAVERMLFSRFVVRLDGSGLQADLWGEAIDRARHSPAVEVKGATLTDLKVAAGPDDTWIAQCIVDV